MPYSIEVFIQPTDNSAFDDLSNQRDLSSALRGLVLSWFINAGVEREYVTDSRVSPYTISPIYSTYGRFPAFRITLLDDKLWEPLEKEILNRHYEERYALNPKILFLVKHLEVKHSVFSDFIQANQTHHNIAFRFSSPTTFKQSRKNYPLPEPSTVFGSLIRKWNDFCDSVYKIDIDWLEWAKKELSIVGVNQSTRTKYLHSARVELGLVGEVEYRMLRQKNTYADLACSGKCDQVK